MSGDIVERLRALADGEEDNYFHGGGTNRLFPTLREAAAEIEQLRRDLSLAVEALTIAEAVLRNASPFETSDGGAMPVTSVIEAARRARDTLAQIGRGK